MSQFCHLHLHSQYSVLDGAIKIKQLVKRAKELGQNSVAVTDHGSMHGAIEFYQYATEAGVKPIIGCEVYIAGKGRFVKSGGQHENYHLTLLATSHEGYKNLCKLVTLGYMEGFYFKPRVDHELLENFNKDIICLSGCIAGELASFTLDGDYEGARAIAIKYSEMFKGRYYLEVQPHEIPEQKRHNEMVTRLAEDLGLPMVATNDCHYLNADDHHAQEVLMCISTQKLITDPTRIKHENAQLFLKSYDEMLLGLPRHQEALRMTTEIAERCNLEFDFSKHYMPSCEVQGESIEEMFTSQSRQGLEERFTELNFASDDKRREEYKARLEMELACILKMGFAGYFLVVSDFIRWAKENGIPVGPGRGSAAGSLVAYALLITEVDPIKYLLLFERFLNPERVSLPDIDVDFCIHGREKVIEYVCEKYGKDKVSQILTFGTLKAKAAIRDVGRVLGFSFAETDRIAKLIPAPRQGFDYPLTEAIQMEKKLKEYAEGEGKELIDLALKLEGLSRHTSTHAAGIVISDKPIVEYLPLMLDKEGQVVTQYSMNWVEKIGLVKFDFLGLKTLSVIDRALTLIDEFKGHEGKKHWLNINSIPLDDARTFKLVSSGRTIGVFQLESSGITEMVTRLKPNCFEDLVAILALYRPGPLDAGMVDHYINRKHGREPTASLHPSIDHILKDTYGIILYQEQIMQIARDMGGYSLAEADMLRRAMGKKKPEEMAKQRDFFLKGASQKKVPDQIAASVFDQMETFARYGFNRSHSVAYALISYQTAYLKANYPRQLMAALMTFEMGDTDKTLKNLQECTELKIAVLPPNVNYGGVGFSVVDKSIVYGLAAIKGVGEKIVERVIGERDSGGKFTGILDFCTRLQEVGISRRTLESFIKAGAFDWIDATRHDMHEHVEDFISIGSKLANKRSSNQMSLFADDVDMITTDQAILPRTSRTEWPTNIKLSKEREALGFYLSGHPLERFSKELSRLGVSSSEDVKTKSDGSVILMAGVVTFLKLKNTKKGDRYASFVFEDLKGTIEVLVWPDTYKTVHELLSREEPLLLKARVDVSDERVVLVANELGALAEVRDASAAEAHIVLREDLITERTIKGLKKTLNKYKGDCKVKVSIKNPKHSEVLMSLPDDFKITPSEEFCIELEKLFGSHVVSFR